MFYVVLKGSVNVHIIIPPHTTEMWRPENNRECLKQVSGVTD
jgi:hypothetical protein